MKHQYSEILIAIANGEIIQFIGEDGYWDDQSHDTTLAEILHQAYAHQRYRIKPKTVMVNGVECPPTSTPEKYKVRITSTGFTTVELWYSTSEDAATVFNALVKPFKEKE